MIHSKVGRKSVLLLKCRFGESGSVHPVWEAVVWGVFKEVLKACFYADENFMQRNLTIKERGGVIAKARP